MKVYVKDEQRVTAYEAVTESEVLAPLKKERTEEAIIVPLP
ncbi:hypothetical protein [Exiguobacterium sp. s21]|nr:hypothetical protein [Exiguobacterium sp. s21]